MFTTTAIALGCLGLGLRFFLALASIGCDDVKFWRIHGETIAAHGVAFAYQEPHPRGMRYNHPPLPGYMAASAFKASAGSVHEFSLRMKVLGLVAELLSATLVYRIWSRRRPGLAALAFAGYGLSLPLILVSGYHCNTDCAMAGMTLLSVYLMQGKRRPFLSGLALAAALNIKLMPLVLIPAVLSQCRSRRDLLHFGVGLGLAIVPFAPFLLHNARDMYAKMITYNSEPLDWGINAFLNYLGDAKPFAPITASLKPRFLASGRYLIIMAITLLSAIAALRRRPFGYEMAALAWALFLILTPGYAVQYAVCVLPLLFVVDLRRAFVYSLCAGLLLLIVYARHMELTYPLQASVQYHPFPSVAVLFGILAWGSLLGFAFDTIRTLVRPSRIACAADGQRLSRYPMSSAFGAVFGAWAAARPSSHVEQGDVNSRAESMGET